jgi:hypothetical protein
MWPWWWQCQCLMCSSCGRAKEPGSEAQACTEVSMLQGVRWLALGPHW